MLFERQKYLLALVDALGGDVGVLDFQKLLFFCCRESEPAPTTSLSPTTSAASGSPATAAVWLRVWSGNLVARVCSGGIVIVKGRWSAYP